MPGSAWHRRRRRRRVLRRRIVVIALPLLALAAGLLFAHAGTGRPVAGRSAARSRRETKPEKRAPKTASAREAGGNPFASPAMDAYLSTRTGEVTAALYDLTNGRTYLLHPGEREQTASIVKVDILATLLWQAQEAGQPLSADQQGLAQEMIEQSSDDDATALWDEIGGAPAVAHFDSLAGLTDTFPNTEGYWGETLTTALDQVDLLKQLVLPGSLLDADSRSYELGLMENVIPYDYWGISAGVPHGVTVALKNGWVPLTSYQNWEINSIGWVHGDGRDYLVAVLTSGDPTEEYGIDTIEGMSKLLWPALPETAGTHR